MEAATPLRQPHVRTAGDRLAIDGLVVEDERAARLVREREEAGQDPVETVTDAIEIGARLLDREGTRAEVDFVRREFERASVELERSFGERAQRVTEELNDQLERFLGEDNGAIAKALEVHSDALSELVAQHFGADRSTAVQNQLREQVRELLDQSRHDLLKQFSTEEGHNPLADFKAAVVREVEASKTKYQELVEKLVRLEGQIQQLGIVEQAEARLAEERERGTSKGRDFEQQAFELIEEMASARGDVAHHVGDARSESGGKRGDVVIEIDAASGKPKGRIALDAKDEKLSKNRAWEVLNASLAERDAGFAILVVASDEKVPSGRDPLHEYEGNKMIVTLDKETFDSRPLELAYRYARCRCLMSAERQLEIDAPGVRDAAEEALSALKDTQKIRSSLTGASKNVKNADSALDAMVQRVQASLERIEALITAAEND
jgi:hypothetical protein